ncbi:MAG: hypothetical protein ACTSRA_19815, partial [Promethearchaeota archaeon]
MHANTRDVIPTESIIFSGDEFKKAVNWALERSDEQILVYLQGVETFEMQNALKTLPKVLIKAGYDFSKLIIKELITSASSSDKPRDGAKLEIFKEIEIKGYLLKAKSGFRNNFMAISCAEGFIGNVPIPEGTIITIGGRRSNRWDVRTNIIQLENQFKKNYEQRKYYDGCEFKEACNYLNEILETIQVNAQVWGTWVKTKQTFYGRGRVLKIIQRRMPSKKYIAFLIEQAKVGQDIELE